MNLILELYGVFISIKRMIENEFSIFIGTDLLRLYQACLTDVCKFDLRL